MQVHLIRHGQSQWQTNQSDSNDSDITALGKIQARYLNNYIRNLINDDLINTVIYVSPLKRTLQTVQSLGIHYTLEPTIKEAIFYVASSLPQFENPIIYERQQSNDPQYVEFKASIKNTLENIINKNNNKNLYLYTHGGVIKTILRIMHDNDSICYKINNCSISKIIWDKYRWKISTINNVSFIPKNYIT